MKRSNPETAEPESKTQKQKLDDIQAPAPAEDEEEEDMDPKLLPTIEKDYQPVDAWMIDPKDIFVADNNGKPEFYLIKQIPGKPGIMGKGSLNLRSPPLQAVLTTVVGTGVKPKLKNEKEYGFLATPAIIPGQESNPEFLERVTNEWKKTFEILDCMKDKMCRYLSQIPNCQISVYIEVAEIVFKTLTAEEQDIIKNKKKKTKAFKQAYEQKIYEHLMSIFQVHHGMKSKYTEKLQSPNGVINKWYINASTNSYRAIPKEEINKTFDVMYPNLKTILDSGNNSDPRFEMAQEVFTKFNSPPTREGTKVTETRTKLCPIRTYAKEPVYLPNGRVKRDANGAPIMQQKRFELFDRRLTNRDIFQMEFFCGGWFYGKMIGLLSKLTALHIIVPRPHVPYSQELPETSYSASYIPDVEDKPMDSAGGLHPLPYAPAPRQNPNNMGDNNNNNNDPVDYSHAYFEDS
jgi:hypothetical protein